MKVEVTPAVPGESEVIANLMSLYLHEFSDVDANATGDVGEDGRFKDRYLERYWSEPGRYPFLIWVDDRLAGFALVARGEIVEPGSSGHTIAEFFILRAYRRKRVGEQTARALFDKFPGHWSVPEHPTNEPAQAFWRAVIGRYTNRKYEERHRRDGGNDAIVQTFDNSSPAAMTNVFDREAWEAHERALARFHDWEAAHTRGDDDLDTAWAWYQEIWKLARETGAIDSARGIDMKRMARLRELESRLAQLVCPS